MPSALGPVHEEGLEARGVYTLPGIIMEVLYIVELLGRPIRTLDELIQTILGSYYRIVHRKSSTIQHPFDSYMCVQVQRSGYYTKMELFHKHLSWSSKVEKGLQSPSHSHRRQIRRTRNSPLLRHSRATSRISTLHSQRTEPSSRKTEFRARAPRPAQSSAVGTRGSTGEGRVDFL